MNNKDINNFNDDNKEGNLRVRKDWQNLKKIILNRDYLIVFIAVSVLIFDFAMINIYSSYLREGSGASTAINTATPVVEELVKEPDQSVNDSANADSCNVAGINLHGDLITYYPRSDYSDSGDLNVDEVSSEEIYFAVKGIEKKENIKAIIVEIDSPGGQPVAAEELEKVFKSSSKPVIVYIRSMGVSAAYWAATGADRIFALPSSQVGSIAVNSSYMDATKNNQKEGYTFNDLTSGKFKNTMNSNKPLTDEERALVMKDLNITHDLFVKTVAENRKLDINKVKEIANGWAYTGSEALSLGLVDELGGLAEVSVYLKNNVLNGEDPEICWQILF